MSTTVKPLPCPFCGCKPRVVHFRNHFTSDDVFVACKATRCQSQPGTIRFDTRAEAIAAWNRRTKCK